MKWVIVASIVCCGGLLLLILIGANVGLILGLILNNWIAFLLGLLVLIADVIYYVWRRYRQRKGHSWR